MRPSTEYPGSWVTSALLSQDGVHINTALTYSYVLGIILWCWRVLLPHAHATAQQAR